MGTLDSIAQGNEEITWQLAHATLSRLARERAAVDAEEGRWLLAAQRAAVHVHLGFSAFSEYIERLFGYKPRSVQEKLRVAEALESLPALSHALSGGKLSWSAVRELTRVVVSETEHEWLECARGKTLRQLEQVLAGRRQGDAPGSLPDPRAQRHVLRFEVVAETFALFRDALRELRRRAGAGGAPPGAPRKPLPQPCAAPCSCATSAAARCPAVRTRAGSTFTTSSPAPQADAIHRTT